MREDVQIYVLDSSAWLTLIEDEEGADFVQQILEKAYRVKQRVVYDNHLNLQ